MELNTLEAFQGVVRQGELIALLPKSAVINVQQDSTLAVRSLEKLPESVASSNKLVGSISALDSKWTRQVVLVTTRDRLEIPPIQHFCKLVRQLDMPTVQAWNVQLPALAQA
ncbi:MAG: LysR family transcriptional regulator, partial [Moorea sp. SIO3I7]|nr:LysR family transcriptional regulator [Moorena sp. SIO3I7]